MEGKFLRKSFPQTGTSPVCSAKKVLFLVPNSKLTTLTKERIVTAVSPEEQAEIDKVLEELDQDPLVQRDQSVWQNRHLLPDALRKSLEEAAGLTEEPSQTEEREQDQEQTQQRNQDQQMG